MSLESAIADLVSASTGLTQSVNVTRAAVEATRDSVLAQETPTETAKVAAATAATNATTSAATTASQLTAAASDYATQKTTKGLAAVQTSADSELADRLHRRDPARHPFRGARPSLVMDFVRQECHRNNAAGNLEPVDLNSFMTFTRASTATVVGPDGLIKEVASNVPRYGYDPVTGEALGLLIEEQRTNLFPYSAYPAATTSETKWWWHRLNCDVYPNVAVAPDGTMTAAKAVVSVGAATTGNDGVGVFATPNVTSSDTHTLTMYVKDAGAGYLRIRESINTGQIAKVNLTTGAITAEAGYTTATFTVTATDVGNGWWRVAVVRTPTTKFGFNLKPGIDVGDGVSGIYIWGAQLEAGAFPTSYIPTPATFTGRASTKTYFDSNGVLQTASSGVAVTDHGYVDGRWVSKGLSLEPQATNLLLQSQDFTGYSVNGTIAPTISRGTVLSPTGVLSCADVTFAAGSGSSHGVFMSGIDGTLGTTYTASVFLKAGIGSVFRMSIEGSVLFGGSSIVDFDQATGNASVQSTGGAPVTIRVTQFGAWYRISLTRTAVANGEMTICFYSGIDGANRFVIYGAQIETGPVATSYIPTTTAQVTRAADTSTSAQVTRGADNAVSTQAAALYNLDGGTTCVSTQQYVRGSWPGLYHWDGDYSIFAMQNGNYLSGRGSSGAVGFASAAIGGSLKHALRQNRTTVSASQNAAGPISASLPRANSATVSRLVVGKGTTDRYNGHIKQLTYFPRQLSDADLQALTILED